LCASDGSAPENGWVGSRDPAVSQPLQAVGQAQAEEDEKKRPFHLEVGLVVDLGLMERLGRVTSSKPLLVADLLLQVSRLLPRRRPPAHT